MSTVVCQYCGVTSQVGRTPGGPPHAPQLRIEEPPPIDSSIFGAVILIVAFGACFIFAVVLTVSFASGYDRLGVGFMALLFGAATAAPVYMAFDTKREARELQWFRDHGIPGRATIERICTQGAGSAALLGLELELHQQPKRHLDHQTTVPVLLIPRLTQGLTLPIIVHPRDPARIEIQWHLV